MSYDLKILQKDFENELWLYLDGALPEEKIKYWNTQLEIHPELRKKLDETKRVLSIYNENALVDVEDPVLQAAFTSIKEKKNIVMRLLALFKSNGRSGDQYNTVKIAFGGALAVAAIVMLLTTEKPNPIKDMSSELLDWNAKEITAQMDEMDLSIKFAKDDKLKKYLINKMLEDDWDRDVLIIDSGIKEMKKEIKETSL